MTLTLVIVQLLFSVFAFPCFDPVRYGRDYSTDICRSQGILGVGLFVLSQSTFIVLPTFADRPCVVPLHLFLSVKLGKVRWS